MPRLSVWSVRLALLYLLFGFTLGAVMLANKGVAIAPWAWDLLPGHIDVLVFGFVIQFAAGIAYWILPRYRGGSRGNEKIVWVSIGLLNLGVWIACLAGWFHLPGFALAAGRSLEGLAAVLFATQAWRRIRPT